MRSTRKLIALNDEALREFAPDWPKSAWSTRRLILRHQLGCVRIGTRVYVTPELLEEFVRRNTEQAAS